MTSIIDKFKFINTAQHGFQERDSTKLALVTIYDKLLSNVNDNKLTRSVLLDLNKAFDTVNHDTLIKKNPTLRFQGQIFKHFKIILK